MTDVNLFPMPWLMTADKAAHKIARALAKKKKVFNFPWQTTLLMKLSRWIALVAIGLYFPQTGYAVENPAQVVATSQRIVGAIYDIAEQDKSRPVIRPANRAAGQAQQ